MTHVQKHTAQLLKEKGFEMPNADYYVLDGRTLTTRLVECTPEVTLHEATDWLRKTKGVHVSVQIINEGEGICYYHPNIQDVSTGEYFESEIFDGEYTHDLALEAGIIYACKHYVK